MELFIEKKVLKNSYEESKIESLRFNKKNLVEPSDKGFDQLLAENEKLKR